MKIKIGIFGSAVDESEQAIQKAHQLADALIEHKDNIILLTGACPGMPNQIASRAAKQGVEVWGYSPAINLESHQQYSPQDDVSIYSKLIFITQDYEFKDKIRVCYKYRNVTSTATCDAGIIVSGRWGTLNEFTNLYDMEKVVGVFQGTGGIADELETLYKKINKPSKAKMVFASETEKLVKEMLIALR